MTLIYEAAEAIREAAMPARTLRRLLRERVESFLPEGALDAVKAAEESERAGLEAIADAIDDEAGGRAGEFIGLAP